MEQVIGREIKVRMVGSEVHEKLIRLNSTVGESIAAGTLCARLLPFFQAGSPVLDELDDGADQSVTYDIIGVAKDGTTTVLGARDTIDDDFLESLEALNLSPHTVAGS